MMRVGSPWRQFVEVGHWPTLLCAFLYFDVSFLLWMLIGSLAIFLAQELNLSPAEKGLMVAVPVLSGACLRVLAGVVADRVGARRAALLGMGLTGVALLSGGLLIRDFTTALVTGALLGVAGASFAIALPLASRWYPPEYQGLAMGIAGAGNSGTVLAAFFAPRLAEWVGWRGVFLWALLPLCLTLVVFLAVVREPPGPAAQPSDRRLFGEGDLWWLCAFYMLTFGGFVGLGSFLPVLLADQYALPAVTAGSWTAACVLAGSGLRPVGGWLADRNGGVPVLSGVFLLVAALALYLTSLPEKASGIAALVALVGALGIGNGAVFQLVGQRFSAHVGKATGMIGAAGGLGGFVLPSLLGAVRQWQGGYGAGFAVFACAALTVWCALRVLERRWRRTWGEEWEPAVS